MATHAAASSYCVRAFIGRMAGDATGADALPMRRWSNVSTKEVSLWRAKTASSRTDPSARDDKRTRACARTQIHTHTHA
jgi:hypothetical protein